VAASNLGADCYIRKPSCLDEFMAIGKTFQDLLSRSRTDRDLTVSSY
jgi:hypothetical protein